MISRTIGRRYAKALMAVALDRQEAPAGLLAELEGLAAALATEPRFAELLASPKLGFDERLRALERFLDAAAPSPLTRHVLRVLLQKGRLGALDDIVAEFRTLADLQAGVVRASVVSAAALSPEETERLRALLSARFGGRRVELSSAVDPELIGGLVVRVGSLSFDGSIRSQLKAIHRQLLEEVTFS